jgi:hypothetical protein
VRSYRLFGNKGARGGATKGKRRRIRATLLSAKF